MREIPPANYVIQRTKQGPLKVVHGDKLKAWGGDPLPSWLENPVEGSVEEQPQGEPKANEETAEEHQSVEPERCIEVTVPKRKRDKRQGTQQAPEVNEANEEQALPTLDRPKRDRRLPPRLAGYQL